MAETLVKEKICNACGVEVRPQAMFCYNCGSAVAPDVPLDGNNKKVGNAWFRDDPTGEKSKENINKTGSLKDEPVEPVIDERNETANIVETEDDAEIVAEDKAEKRDLSKMDSAAKLRSRGKSVQKKRVEIVWEEHDNAPNGWFIFFAVILVILAVTIWIISTYLQ